MVHNIDFEQYEVLRSVMTDPCSVSSEKIKAKGAITEIGKLLDLTLLSAIVSQNLDLIDLICYYGKSYHYLFGINTEACRYVLKENA